jgi:hypothetical protein
MRRKCFALPNPTSEADQLTPYKLGLVPMLPDMKKNEDGPLTMYIQNKSPGKDDEANRLPGAGWPDPHGHAALLAEG